MWHLQLSSLFVLTLPLLFGHCEGYSLVVTPDVVVVQETMDHVWLTCSKKTEGGHEENLESPACHINWYKDERLLCNSAKYNMTKEKLRIGYPLTGVDSGVYTCVCCFCNCLAYRSASAVLWVPPDVTANPNQSVTIGHTGFISCNLSGIITKIFWYKNGRYITKWKTGTRWKGNYFPYSNGTLGIRDVMLDSDGYYDCVAMNKAGMNSARIYVELKWPQSVAQETSKCPKVLGPDVEEIHSDRETRESRGLESKLVAQDVIAEEANWTEEDKQRKTHSPVILKVSHTCVSSVSGERLHLDCRVVGYPIPVIYWSKVGGFRKNALKNHDIWADPHKLTINKLQYSDRGLYRCHVQYLNEERIYYIRVQVVDINKYCGKLHFSSVNKRHTFDFDMYQSFSHHNFTKRVSGGSDVQEMKLWPWQALITYNPSVWPYSDSFCGGVIIDRTKVLTAYHCTIKSLQTHEVFHNEDVIVTVGVLNKTSAYESTRTVYSVKAIYRLSVITTNRDISVIELNEEISYTEHVRPICLPIKSHDSHPTPGSECIVSGYGWTSPSGPSANILRQGTVQIVSWDECKSHFSFISSDTMCTSSGEEGIGSCPNDSGGPLACRRSNGQWVVFGIVGGGTCAMVNGYNYYSNVSSNLQWIKFPSN